MITAPAARARRVVDPRAWDIGSTWSDLDDDDDARAESYIESASLCVALPIPLDELVDP